MLPFHATNEKKKLVSAMDWQQEPIAKKLALEFFVKIIYATSTVPLFLQLFYSLYLLYSPTTPPQKVSFN